MAEFDELLLDITLCADALLPDELLESGGTPVAIDTIIHAIMQIIAAISATFCKERLILSDIVFSCMSRQKLINLQRLVNKLTRVFRA